MASIEIITSREKTITIKKKDGTENTLSVRIWNETVSNLSLMALGSSAPEILLSVIEIMGNKFKAGELGPGTIVGSAAFNLFIIMAVCVYAIPEGEVRKVHQFPVLICTGTFSVFAYVWLYVIIIVITPECVDVIEALLTFLFFPLLVGIAYVTDKKIFFMKFLKSSVQVKNNKKVIKNTKIVKNAANGTDDILESEENKDVLVAIEHSDDDTSDGDENPIFNTNNYKKLFFEKFQELRDKFSQEPDDKIEKMATYEVLDKQHKSRAFYRVAATRKLHGGGDVLRNAFEKQAAVTKEMQCVHYDRVYFDPIEYTVIENISVFEITVRREGKRLNYYSFVDYKTVDGTALAKSDYHHTEGILVFKPRENEKTITIRIIDDEIFEVDEYFFVELSNLRSSLSGEVSEASNDIKCQLENGADCAKIIILDDDHCGYFSFENDSLTVAENEKELHVKVNRTKGARGVVKLPFMTIDGSAKGGGVDYKDAFGELLFGNNETQKDILVRIIDDEEYEKAEIFFLCIGTPTLVKRNKGIDKENFKENLSKDEKIALQGRPCLGEITKCTVTIVESIEFKDAIDRMLQNEGLINSALSTNSWREQFIDAVTFRTGKSGHNQKNEPSLMEYVMYLLALLWKIVFAVIPPTCYMGGWACFAVSIFGIGVMTAMIGDLASHFGCTVHLRDSVTAISIVALGTSLPDLFASKTAAINDKSADASIVNVTGSNAVNVFLGIGVAWTLASTYHLIKGTEAGFEVKEGSLAFSVTLFCVLAIACLGTLLIRRVLPWIGAELGGPRKLKIATSVFFVFLWLLYIGLSALVSYCILNPSM